MNKEAMKEQTIGVEVEMNNISRREAARIASEFFETGLFKQTYRVHGNCAWSAWDAKGREWKFVKDCSIHGNPTKKCELVTPILHYNDIEMLQELCRELRRAGAKSNADRGCGVHIHIGGHGQTPESLRNLVNIMAGHEDLLRIALKLDRYRIEDYCSPVDCNFLRKLNRVKPKSFSELADVWYDSQYCDGRRTDHYNSTRYHMLNLHSFFNRGTIEFRLFQFDNPEKGRKNGIHAGQLKAYIQLSLALCNAAKEPKRFNHVPRWDKVYKDTMLQWLYRLGLSGDEFKTARYFLSKNLKEHELVRLVA